MRTLFAPRALHYFVLGLLSCLVGFFTRRIEPVLFGLPFFSTLLLALVTGFGVPEFSLDCSLHQARVQEGGEAVVDLVLRAASHLPLVEYLHHRPPGSSLVSGYRGIIFDLWAGERRKIRSQFRLERRGEYSLGRFVLRVHNPGGLVIREFRHNYRLQCLAYPRIRRIRSSSSLHTDRMASGVHLSPYAGPGMEFDTVGEYRPGDVVRRVNWRASARHDGLFVNRFLEERMTEVLLLIDALENAGTPENNVLDHTIRRAAEVATELMENRDRVGVMVFGQSGEWVPPQIGHRHWHRIMDRLSRIRGPGGRDYGATAFLPPARVLPDQGFILAWSSLLNSKFTDCLRDLVLRGHHVILASVAPHGFVDEVVESGSGVDHLALRLWRLEYRSTLEELTAAGIKSLPLGPEDPVESLLHRLSRLEFRRYYR